MPRRSTIGSETEPAEFVCRETAAQRCEISVDTWDLWVRSGYAPAPAIERGQIIRWDWAECKAHFKRPSAAETDPYMQGVANADQKARGRAAS